MIKSQPWTLSHLQMVLSTFMVLVGVHFMVQRSMFWLSKQIFIPCWMKVVFGAATEMGGFTPESPKSILGATTFLYIHIQFISIGCKSYETIRLKYFCILWFPENTATNANATPNPISSDTVICVFEYLLSAFLNARVQYQNGGVIEKRRKSLELGAKQPSLDRKMVA